VVVVRLPLTAVQEARSGVQWPTISVQGVYLPHVQGGIGDFSYDGSEGPSQTWCATRRGVHGSHARSKRAAKRSNISVGIRET
jgi:hypothetical protein